MYAELEIKLKALKNSITPTAPDGFPIIKSPAEAIAESRPSFTDLLTETELFIIDFMKDITIS